MAAVIVPSDFGAQENKTYHFPFFPHLFAMKQWDQMPWSWFFWMLSFKPAFSLSSFNFNRLFDFSSLYAIWMVSSAYLMLLIFFLAILI